MTITKKLTSSTQFQAANSLRQWRTRERELWAAELTGFANLQSKDEYQGMGEKVEGFVLEI